MPLADSRDRERLDAVPVRTGQGCDRPGVVEEGMGVVDGRAELELVRDVVVVVAVVVDVDLVQDVVAEFVEVGAAGRTFAVGQ